MGAEITLRWEEATLATMHGAVRDAYPHEACGFLVGRDTTIYRVVPVANLAAEPRRDYRIAPETLLAIHREATVEGLDVLGVFHSHPDGEARLSMVDEQQGHPGWVYAVVATRGREPSDLLVCRL